LEIINFRPFHREWPWKFLSRTLQNKCIRGDSSRRRNDNNNNVTATTKETTLAKQEILNTTTITHKKHLPYNGSGIIDDCICELLAWRLLGG